MFPVQPVQCTGQQEPCKGRGRRVLKPRVICLLASATDLNANTALACAPAPRPCGGLRVTQRVHTHPVTPSPPWHPQSLVGGIRQKRMSRAQQDPAHCVPAGENGVDVNGHDQNGHTSFSVTHPRAPIHLFAAHPAPWHTAPPCPCAWGEEKKATFPPHSSPALSKEAH